MSKSQAKTPKAMVIRKTAGKVRGPIQFTWAESLHPILVDSACITRCCVTNKDKEDDERTMGSKHRVPYGLYRFHVYVSPSDAENTKFDSADLALLENALLNLFDEDRSAMRGEMTVRKLFKITHESKYGNAPAHKIFGRIKTTLKPGVKTPQSFEDYDVVVDTSKMPANVSLTEIESTQEIGKQTFKPIENRCEYEVLVDVKNGNPNGNPDADGRPRQDPVSTKGLITDVCLKRKVRNYVQTHYSSTDTRKIFFQEGAVLNDLISDPYESDPAVKAAFEAKIKKDRSADPEGLAQRNLCGKYYDIRTFGAVLSTGDKETVGGEDQPEVVE